MIRSLLIVIMFTQFNQSAMAHKCILNGNSAAEITVYNACKNDLAFGDAGHDTAHHYLYRLKHQTTSKIWRQKTRL